MKPDVPALYEEPFEREGSEEFVTISRVELEMLRATSQMLSEKASPPPTPIDQGPDQKGAGIDDRESAQESRLRKELEEREARLASIEKQCREAVRDRDLATILAGKPLVPGAASQLIKLWRDAFDVYEEGGALKVATRDGRKPAQVVNEWLASAEYSHFCLPTSQGGTGARDASRPGATPQLAESPKNLGEAIVMKWRREADSRGDKATNPIGLKRRR